MGRTFSCLAPIPEARELENGNVIQRDSSPSPAGVYNQTDVQKMASVSDTAGQTDVTTNKDISSDNNDLSSGDKRTSEEREVEFESKSLVDLGSDMKPNEQGFVLADSKVKVRKKSIDNQILVIKSESPKCSPSPSMEDLIKKKILNRALQHNGEEAQEIVGGAKLLHVNDSNETTVCDNIDGRHFQGNTLGSENDERLKLMPCSANEMCSPSLSVHSCTQVSDKKLDAHINQQDFGTANKPFTKKTSQASTCGIDSPLATTPSSESIDKKSISSLMVPKSLFIPEKPRPNTLRDDLRGLLESTIMESLSRDTHAIRHEGEIASAYSPVFATETNLRAESTDTQNKAVDVDETKLLEKPATIMPLIIKVQSVTEATLSNDGRVGSEEDKNSGSELYNTEHDNLASCTDKVAIIASKSLCYSNHTIVPEIEITHAYSPVFTQENNLESESTDKQNKVVGVEETKSNLLEKPTDVRPLVIKAQSATNATISKDDTVGNEGENKMHTGLDNIGSNNQSETNKVELTIVESLSSDTHSIRHEHEITSAYTPVFTRENLTSESAGTQNRILDIEERQTDLLENPSKIKPLIINVQSTTEATLPSNDTVGNEGEAKSSTGLDKTRSDNPGSDTNKDSLNIRKSSSCGTQTIRLENVIRSAYSPVFIRETNPALESADKQSKVFSTEKTRSDLPENSTKIKPLIINVQSATDVTASNDDAVGSEEERRSSSATKLPVVR